MCFTDFHRHVCCFVGKGHTGLALSVMWQCWEVQEQSDVCVMMGRWVEGVTAKTVWCHWRKNSGWSRQQAFRIKLHLFYGTGALQCGCFCTLQRVSHDTMRACLQIKRVKELLENAGTVEHRHRAGWCQVKEVGLGTNRIQEMGPCLKRG